MGIRCAALSGPWLLFCGFVDSCPGPYGPRVLLCHVPQHLRPEVLLSFLFLALHVRPVYASPLLSISCVSYEFATFFFLIVLVFFLTCVSFALVLDCCL